MATSQLICDKIQITGFRKTQDNRAENLRTDSSNKSQNDIQMMVKRMQSTHEKAQLERIKISKLFHKRVARTSSHANL